MQIQQIQAYNTSNKFQPFINAGSAVKNNFQPQFTSFAGAAKQSTGLYDRFTEWIANNYYKRFYNSKAAKCILEHTKSKKWNNMTTHMSALGSTLISSMYIIRTLQNDKLDHEKRKTLALNDLLTWGVSTAGAYFLDAKLSNWWENVTTRFTANYLLDNKDSRKPEVFGNWKPENLKDMMANWQKYVNKDSKEGKELLEKLGTKAYNNIRDFNLDVLKDTKLTTLIDGMGTLKSLFVFGMVYRYIVPVLVMKPANYLGQYLHNKKDHKKQENIQ